MGVGPFRRGEHALRYRPSDCSAEAFEQFHRDGTFALAHHSKRWAADVLEGSPDLEHPQTFKPLRKTVYPESTERSLQVDLRTRRDLLIWDAVDLRQGEWRRV